MARNRYRAPRPPKPPKPPKPIRPKVKDLRGIYKGLITTDIGQRLDILLYALKWYDAALDYITLKQKGVLTPDQLKMQDKSIKCRLQGQGTTFVGEKEMAYRRALVVMERVAKDVLQPPLVDTYYKLLDSKKAKLEAKTDRWEEKYGDTIQLFEKILKPKNREGLVIGMEISPIDEPVHKDAELKRLAFRPDVAKAIHKKRIREGVLAAVLESVTVMDRKTPPVPVEFSFLEELARLSAMEKQLDQNQEWTGQYIAKEGLQKLALLQMLRNVTEWARTDEAPKRLVRLARPEVGQPTNGQPPKPRAPRVGGFGGKKGPLIDGAFADGSDIAKLFVTLKGKTGQWFQKKDLQAMISTKLDGRLQVIDKKSRGRWKIEKNGPEVRLVMAPAQP